jgi:dipeptidyl aminopeptidase/acylaminoacyl peptidase
VEATWVMVENEGHGFTTAGGLIQPTRIQISNRMADFFDTHLE